MSAFLGYLELLVTSSQDVPYSDRLVVDKWTTRADSPKTDGIPSSQLNNVQVGYDQNSEEAVDRESSWHSVVDIYKMRENDMRDTIMSKLLLKSNVKSILKSLQPVLSSSRLNDEISGEVAEIIGFDDIQLVTEIINNRALVVEQLESFANLSMDKVSSVSRGRGNNDETGPRGSENDILSAHRSLEGLDSLSPSEARLRMEETFRANANRPLFSANDQKAFELLPHVYTSMPMAQNNILSQFGSKYTLPIGTVRHLYEDYEEVIIPPAKPVPPRMTERLISVSELPPLAKGSFKSYSNLNRIQSIVYPTAYGSNENMLICAPTGAGKTDVALLSILRVLDQHRSTSSQNGDLGSTIDKDSFKIIYVAPMKALASEIVRKLSKRLQWLSIRARELTGDMQMTKTEIAQTQIIVTTPEKWDVVTRKPTGEGELTSSLKLLIIDEVHLLNEERGAIIETIVARTLRQVESSQSLIRIVGLSATLPNYMDVAEFLSVSKYKGLFYFDSSFRPIPLEQHFLGVKGKPGSQQLRRNMDRVTFQKVSDLVAEGHQVMVFVHARKETVKTAMGLKDAAVIEGNSDNFSCEENPQWSLFRRHIGESKNKEMKLLFDSGFGIHHAGMLRSDRHMMEQMFEARAIKVLCCTATLAWGVNLPAHAVIIKGTQVYDSSKGAFVDLSVLDVLQVFGRAGRPGFETSGEGYICTTEDKLPHYLDAVISQNPIESQFQEGMADSLNAEISLGTITNTRDAVQWLGYTYLFVRMRKNPFRYGISREATDDDPQLGNKRNQLITSAAQKLADTHMVIFDRNSGAFASTDLGRIAAKYYIRYTSIEIFYKEFRPEMTEADVLRMLSMSTEYDQIQIRESEVKELERLMEIIPYAVKGGTDTSQGKVNILLQGYISRQPVEDFALVSDTAYVAQNGGRIVRALLEIAISRKWARVTTILMNMSKAIENRLWPFDQPLRQFDLKPDIFYGLERWADEWSMAQLASLSAAELGRLVHLNERHGAAILNAVKQLPAVRMSYDLRPLGFDVLKITLRITRTFSWSPKVHTNVEPFWIWVEDHDGLIILQLSHLLFRQTIDVLSVDFVISIPDGEPPPSVTVRFVSDRWIGAEDEVVIPLDSLIMPAASNCHTRCLDLPFLSLTALRNPVVETIFSNRLNNLNAIQTQTFWNLVHTKRHTLLCAPTGCGKSLMAQILAWMSVLRPSTAWVLIVTPHRSMALETVSGLRQATHASGVSIELSARSCISAPSKNRVIRVVTAASLFAAISQRNPMTALRGLDLVICENLEQLDPAYELGVSLLRHATQSYPTRFVGFANSLNDPADLAAWLGVEPSALHSFRPSDRDQSLTVSTQTFMIPQPASLFKAMAKPVHTVIRTVPHGDSAIVFVPSRGQCRGSALDLLTQCALEMETEKGYLPHGIPDHLLQDYLIKFQDPTLADFVSRGIGFFHEGIQKPDRNLMLEMYAEGIIPVLVVARDSCWKLPVRAAAVVVMGTQYVHVEAEGSKHQLRDYTLTELVRMQSRAVRHSGSGHFYLFCQAEAKNTFIHFLNEGLPLESQILETHDLEMWYQQRQKSYGALDKQQVVDVLSFTFLARRVVNNPTYYNCASSARDENLSRIVDQLLDKFASSSSEGTNRQI